MVDPNWVILYVMVGGLLISSVFTIMKNGRESRTQATKAKEKMQADAQVFGALLHEVQSLRKAIDDSDHGLHAIKEDISKVRTHCAETVGHFSERLSSHDKEIERLFGRG